MCKNGEKIFKKIKKSFRVLKNKIFYLKVFLIINYTFQTMENKNNFVFKMIKDDN